MMKPIFRLVLASSLLWVQSPAQAQNDPRDAVVTAAADLAVGYGMWLWESRCHTMTAAKRADYEAVIKDDLKRMQAASDERLFNAVVGSGRDTSNDPAMADCTGKSADGLADFGLTQARAAQDKLKSLPAGFHLTVTD
jgi:hypothetical protein